MNLDHGKPCPGSVFQLSPRGKFFSSCLFLSLSFFPAKWKPLCKDCYQILSPCVLAQLLPHFREESATCGQFTELILWDQRKPVCRDGHAQRMCGVPCFSQVAQPRARAKPQNNRLVRFQNKQESFQLKSRLPRGRPQSPGLLCRCVKANLGYPLQGAQFQDLPFTRTFLQPKRIVSLKREGEELGNFYLGCVCVCVCMCV